MAKLLFKNGFKEAYAIEGGVRGKNGWLVRCLSLFLNFVILRNFLRWCAVHLDFGFLEPVLLKLSLWH